MKYTHYPLILIATVIVCNKLALHAHVHIREGDMHWSTLCADGWGKLFQQYVTIMSMTFAIMALPNTHCIGHNSCISITLSARTVHG